MPDWQAWALLAWGLLVPGVLIFILIWFNIRYGDRGEKLMCMACLRLKLSPVHWAVRLLGLCPGDSNRSRK